MPMPGSPIFLLVNPAMVQPTSAFITSRWLATSRWFEPVNICLQNQDRLTSSFEPVAFGRQ